LENIHIGNEIQLHQMLITSDSIVLEAFIHWTEILDDSCVRINVALSDLSKTQEEEEDLEPNLVRLAAAGAQGRDVNEAITALVTSWAPEDRNARSNTNYIPEILDDALKYVILLQIEEFLYNTKASHCQSVSIFLFSGRILS
jgi:hypothetical protein